MKPTDLEAPLCRLSLTIAAEYEDVVTDLMQQVTGQPPVAYRKADAAISNISVYYQGSPVAAALVQAALASALARLHQEGTLHRPPRLDCRTVKREDWAESWKKHIRPLKIGSALLIKPSWSSQQPREGQSCVVLDPGLSFGTGQHPTTEFCLRQLVKRRPTGGPQSLLDIGTGTGILAIAAARLGYHPIHAFDFDPLSIKAATDNARINQVQDALRIWRGDLKNMKRRFTRRYKVICANVEFDLLVAEHQKIIQLLAPGGMLILAGILDTQFPRVRETYQRAGLQLVADQLKKEWHSGVFVLPGKTIAPIRPSLKASQLSTSI